VPKNKSNKIFIFIISSKCKTSLAFLSSSVCFFWFWICCVNWIWFCFSISNNCLNSSHLEQEPELFVVVDDCCLLFSFCSINCFNCVFDFRSFSIIRSYSSHLSQDLLFSGRFNPGIVVLTYSFSSLITVVALARRNPSNFVLYSFTWRSSWIK